MAIVRRFSWEPMVGDPDDHRPNTTWAIVVDPGGAEPYVAGLTLLFEKIAPGDRIPLHTHPIDEVIVVDDGVGDVTLGSVIEQVRAQSVVFIPAGTPHGTKNAGNDTLQVHAIFASSQIGITYLERNPAPGTAGRPPAAPSTFDARGER